MSESQELVLGFVVASVVGLAYIILFAPARYRDAVLQFFHIPEWLISRKPKDKTGANGNAWPADNPNAAQADGRRSLLPQGNDAIAFAESSHFTVPRASLDTRYILPEPVETPPSIMKYVRM